MANKVNNWRELLDLANKDLNPQKAYLNVNPNDDGTYNVEIVTNGNQESYAEGYYEDELGGLINDAWAHARAKTAPQIVYRVSAYYDMDICAEEKILQEIYATEELAKARVAQLIKKYKENWHTKEDADDWTEKEDSLEAYGYRPYSWNVEIFWTPEPIRNKIE